MAIGTRRIKRYREDRDNSGAQTPHKKAEPVVSQKDKEKLAYQELKTVKKRFEDAVEEELAYQELKAAKKRFEDAVYNKRHKTTNREELVSAGKIILKGAGRVVDDFFDGAGKISDSVERDIRRHSIQGQIDNTIIRALMEKNKGSKGKGTSKRPAVYVEVKGIDGRPALVDIKTIPAALRGRRR